MDWEPDKFALFLAFFVPGFIALQVYGLFVGIDSSDWAKRLPAVVGYSAIHYAFTGWIILLCRDTPWATPVTYVIVLVLPMFWAPVVLLIRDWEHWQPVFLTPKPPFINLREIFAAALTPEATPWDRVHDGRNRFVRIRLKSGRFVGGLLGVGSVTSTYPIEHEIYISDAFQIDADGIFGKPIPLTGVLVEGSEIETLETIELSKGDK